MRGLIVLLVVAFATPAFAQGADVPALIKLIENQPSDMDRSTWKEKRRDAARKLAATKDKRAVPVLINLAETETFDIIGDIAIHARVRKDFWSEVATALSHRFHDGDFTGGLVEAIELVGAELATHFPRQPGDVNELPDEPHVSDHHR